MVITFGFRNRSSKSKFNAVEIKGNKYFRSIKIGVLGIVIKLFYLNQEAPKFINK